MKMNPVVHFEMGYKNRDRIKKFYETVFGWETQQMGPEMGEYVVAHTTKTDKDGMVQTKGAINGGFYQKTDNPSSHAPSVVISVDDIQEAMKEVKKGGGKITRVFRLINTWRVALEMVDTMRSEPQPGK